MRLGRAQPAPKVSATPSHKPDEFEESDTPIRGSYRWRAQVPAREQTTLSMQYTIKTFVDSELIGGNRRE